MAEQAAVGQTLTVYNSSFLPSPADILFAIPRFAQRASAYAFGSGSVIADATSFAFGSNATSSIPSTVASSAAAVSPPAASFVAGASSGSMTAFFQNLGWYKMSNLEGILSYVGSRWAISTFCIAIVLNRAHVYASSRRQLSLNWQTRLFLRMWPIVFFLFETRKILQTMHCQTGPYVLAWQSADSNNTNYGAFTNEGGTLHRMSSALLLWQDHETSCLKAGMLPSTDSPLSFTGSYTLLWPLFLRLCFSHLIETISSALEGRQPRAETGMTIFEHSLAFAEAEAVVRGTVGLGIFGLLSSPLPTKLAVSATSITSAAAKATKISKAALLSRLNVPPEVLLIALISSCSHISSHTLGILGLQSRFRLVNTGIWGICFMSAFFWSFLRFSQAATEQDVTVLRYPTVCIIGFIPHIIIVAGIFICAMIYGLALLVTMLSPPTDEYRQISWRERFLLAHGNLQANVSLSNIKISWQEEFYTQLLKIGFVVLTSASEAVYFNEGTNVSMAQWTWLEEKRFAQITAARNLSKRLQAAIPPEIQGDTNIAEGVGLIDEDSYLASDGKPVSSGFARERKTTKAPNKSNAAATKEEGVGGSQRSGRWLMSWKLAKGALWLMTCCLIKVVVYIWSKIGLVRVPAWLLNLSQVDKHQDINSQTPTPQSKPLEFWMLSDQGVLHLPADSYVDVELETRKRFANSEDNHNRSEEAIGEDLYGWWKSGGWWGELDGSGDYQPSHPDDDTTSMISMVSDSQNESAWENDDGRRTPTQNDFRSRSSSRESTPFLGEGAMIQISRLLDPKTLEQKQEARYLARRLRRDGPMTRSQYRKSLNADQARILSPHYNPLEQTTDRLTPQEEEDLLAQIILTRRRTLQTKAETGSGPSQSGTWHQGADGMGSDGPQCVVCHSSPRTILVWPCRCLSLCEECRVSLAMNNFASCVCCRRDVVAFSRLFVP